MPEGDPRVGEVWEYAQNTPGVILEEETPVSLVLLREDQVRTNYPKRSLGLTGKFLRAPLESPCHHASCANTAIVFDMAKRPCCRWHIPLSQVIQLSSEGFLAKALQVCWMCGKSNSWVVIDGACRMQCDCCLYIEALFIQDGVVQVTDALKRAKAFGAEEIFLRWPVGAKLESAERSRIRSLGVRILKDLPDHPHGVTLLSTTNALVLGLRKGVDKDVLFQRIKLGSLWQARNNPNLVRKLVGIVNDQQYLNFTHPTDASLFSGLSSSNTLRKEYIRVAKGTSTAISWGKREPNPYPLTAPVVGETYLHLLSDTLVRVDVVTSKAVLSSTTRTSSSSGVLTFCEMLDEFCLSHDARQEHKGWILGQDYQYGPNGEFAGTLMSFEGDRVVLNNDGQVVIKPKDFLGAKPIQRTNLLDRLLTSDSLF